MAIKKLGITEFLLQSGGFPIFDVRSPGEFNHAHMPGVNSLPLFNDEERKIVGTAYKQQGKQKAIKLGLDFFGVKMRAMVEAVEATLKTFEGPKEKIFVHCWRGGMRSAGVAWMLDLYGYDVYTLVGGYKAYRNHVLATFEKHYDIRILGGYTGSGKTLLLEQLKKQGESMIDLEALAKHKGSAFGALGQPAQPTPEMFENMLAVELEKNTQNTFWLEDESQRIGILNIPHAFWKNMRTKPVFFVDIPFEERLDYICQEYGRHPKDSMISSILRIQKRLGPLETKTAIGLLVEDNVKECFRILLAYYDKTYQKSLENRENISSLLNKISCSGVDTVSNTEKLLACVSSFA
ncbi:MAG: mnmH [Ferruginibacter sp.]|nr:mnmH [Ferruginibacter sp.]